VTSDSDLDLVDPGVGRGHVEVTGSRRQQQREQALRRSELKIDLDLRDSLPTCDDVTAALRHADVSDSLTFDYIAANDTRHCVGTVRHCVDTRPSVASDCTMLDAAPSALTPRRHCVDTVRLPDDLREELRLDLRRSSSESSATDDNSFPPPAPASATDEEDEDDDDDDDGESSAASQSATSDGQSTQPPPQLQQQREDGDDPVTETTASRHQRRVEDADGDDPVPDGDLVVDIDVQDAATRHVGDAGEVDRRQSDVSRSQSLRSQQQVIGDDHATAAAATTTTSTTTTTTTTTTIPATIATTAAAAARPTTAANRRAQSSHGAYRTSIARCAGVAMSSAELLRPAPSNHRPQTAV